MNEKKEERKQVKNNTVDGVIDFPSIRVEQDDLKNVLSASLVIEKAIRFAHSKIAWTQMEDVEAILNALRALGAFNKKYSLNKDNK